MSENKEESAYWKRCTGCNKVNIVWTEDDCASCSNKRYSRGKVRSTKEEDILYANSDLNQMLMCYEAHIWSELERRYPATNQHKWDRRKTIEAILQHFQQEQETGEPRECLCQLCNKEYPVWFAPNDLWNRVMRVDGKEEHQFVCPSCFAFKYEKEVEPKTVWMLAPQKGLVYTQSEVDRLIREAEDKVVDWFDDGLPSGFTTKEWYVSYRFAKERLSKQEEGGREA